MSKKLILWLTLIGIVLAIIGAALLVPNAISAAHTCTQEQLNNGTCQPQVSTGMGSAIGVGTLLLIAAAILHFIAWIGALVRSARMQSWGWFVVVLIFGSLGLLIYALAGPPDRPQVPAYPPPGTAPGYSPPPGYPAQSYPPPPGYPSNNYPSYNYPPPGSEYPPPGSGYPPGQAPTVPC
jgi:hypothetical protein